MKIDDRLFQRIPRRRRQKLRKMWNWRWTEVKLAFFKYEIFMLIVKVPLKSSACF